MSEHDDDFDDELAGIFDHLTPEDFSPFRGRIAFDQFITQNLETTRTSWLAADGQINPVAVLATATERWTYVPTDEETLGEYVERLRSEARRLKATWLFLSRKTLVGNYEVRVGDDVPDTSDPDALQKAIEKGIITEGIFYFAERSEDGKTDTRHGLMKPDKDGRLGPVVEGNPKHQTADFFKNILGG